MRQFTVLPFYENNEAVPGQERYMLWGRALSDGALYPIPHGWYAMYLVLDQEEQWAREEGCYRWVCLLDQGRTEMQLNAVRTVPRPDGIGQTAPVLRGETDAQWETTFTPSEISLQFSYGRLPRIITPEPVQKSRATVERPATVWYPDVGLWSPQRRLSDEELALGSEPVGLKEIPYGIWSDRFPGEGEYGPVEAYWDRQEDEPRGLQAKVAIRGTSTGLWDRAGVDLQANLHGDA